MPQLQRHEKLKKSIESTWRRRAKNGIKYLSGGRFVLTAQSPKDIIWRSRKAELWHYHSEKVRFKTPVLLHIGLVSKSYIFDLHPQNSFIKKLLSAGFDVYLLDWGTPDEADAYNTVSTYSIELFPRAIRALLKHADSADFNLISYCMGGCLSLIARAAGANIPCRSMITMAVPIDYSQMGEMANAIGSPDFDVETMLDETGNVPAELVHDSVKVRSPTGDAKQYADLWQNIWNDEFLEGFQSIREWVSDHIPMSGTVFRELREEWIVKNGFVNNCYSLMGSKVDFGSITGPVLCIIAERDELVPLAAAEPLPGLLSGAQVQVERLRAGHVSLTCGGAAIKYTLPTITAWLEMYSDEC